MYVGKFQGQWRWMQQMASGAVIRSTVELCGLAGDPGLHPSVLAAGRRQVLDKGETSQTRVHRWCGLLRVQV
jgi:hypothetical protein